MPLSATANDAALGPARLKGDMRARTTTSTDNDGHGDLTLPVPAGSTVYQDRRLDADTDPLTIDVTDPCTTASVTNERTGSVLVDMDRRLDTEGTFKDCTIATDPPYLDDGRTFSVTFVKNEAGGKCVCNFLRDHLNPDFNPWGVPYGTGFAEDGFLSEEGGGGPDPNNGTCTVTPSPSGVRTSDLLRRTGNPVIRAQPFKEVKIKGQKQPAKTTHLNLRMTVDHNVLDADEISWVTFQNISDDAKIGLIPGSPDVRTVSTSTQFFEMLFHNREVCTGAEAFILPLKITYEPFIIPAQ